MRVRCRSGRTECGNIRALDEALADRLDSYRAHLAGLLLALHARRAYACRVAGYTSWLAEFDPLHPPGADDGRLHTDVTSSGVRREVIERAERQGWRC